MAFGHGAALQQQQAREAMRRGSGMGKHPQKGRIREVWASNLAQEMQNLRELVEKYPYISMVSSSPRFNFQAFKLTTALRIPNSPAS
jgi:CCR4-NOT transcription complex subunit 7/8